MECKEAQNALIDLALGFLPDKIEMEVRSHLLVCDKCSREYEACKTVTRTVAAIPDVSPSEKLREAVLARYREECRRSYSGRLRVIAHNPSFTAYFVRWLLLQLRRPVVVAFLVVVALGCITYLTWFREAESQRGEIAVRALPEKNDFDF